MWSLLPRKAQLTVIVVATLFAAWTWDSVQTLFTGHHLAPLKLVSPAVFIVGVVLTTLLGLSWRWVWQKVPLLGRLLFPDLNGRWEGTLVSNWIDPATGKGIAPIPSTVRIYQRLFNTVVRLKTGESESASTRAFLEPFRESGCFRLWYTYNNDPKAQVRNRSARHEGVAYVEMELATPGQLTGRYYTDRGTMGDMTFTRKNDDPNSQVEP